MPREHMKGKPYKLDERYCPSCGQEMDRREIKNDEAWHVDYTCEGCPQGHIEAHNTQPAEGARGPLTRW